MAYCSTLCAACHSSVLIVILPFSWVIYACRVAHVCSLVLSVKSLTIQFWKSDSLLSFHPVSVPFNINWQCFCWYNIIKILVGLSYIIPSRSYYFTRNLCRSFLYKPISIHLLRWLSGPMSHIPNLHSQISCHTLGFVSRACIPNTEFSNLSILCNLDRLRTFQIIKCCFLFP